MLFARDDTYAAFLLDHAAGNHPESLALAGDLHVLMSGEAARAAWAWSIIGGALLDAEAPDAAHARAVCARARACRPMPRIFSKRRRSRCAGNMDCQACLTIRWALLAED
jgi:hypothetical protein